MSRGSENIRPISGGADPEADERAQAAANRHVEKTVNDIARLHAEHHESASTAQKVIDAMTAFSGTPAFVGWLAAAMAAWILFNSKSVSLGVAPFDPQPFDWLQIVCGTAALVFAALILAAQRKENELADHRDQLTLELAVLSDQKSAKIIELLEELRRDIPNVVDRVDHVADAYAQPVDTKAISDATKKVQEEAR